MNQKILFGILSLAFILTIPLVYVISSSTSNLDKIWIYFFTFLIPLTIISIISFFKFNLLMSNKSIPKLLLAWFIINILFGFIYVVSYATNLGIIRQNYGWYSDMPGLEIFIIIPILFLFSIINLIGMFVARARIIKNKAEDTMKTWILAIVILGIISFLFMFVARASLF